MDKAFGWLFRPFNRIFAWAGNKYSAGVGTIIRKSAIALALYAGLVFLTGWSFNKVPTGFVRRRTNSTWSPSPNCLMQLPWIGLKPSFAACRTLVSSNPEWKAPLRFPG